MIFGIIVLLTALGMASVAAWFAVAGIMAFFAGNAIPAMIMGIVIELGKVVGVSWVYRTWQESSILKYVMIPFIFSMMLLTSAGIFGFLSKAHLEQNAPVANNELRVERLDQQIAREKSKILDAETVIVQLDTTVQTLIDYAKISGENGARAVRENQNDQRALLAATIAESQAKVDQFEDQKLDLNQALKTLELEVGPIKYVAALIYEDAENSTEEAARILILAFIFVFDPMAIMLLMAANHTLMREGIHIEGTVSRLEAELPVEPEQKVEEPIVEEKPSVPVTKQKKKDLR